MSQSAVSLGKEAAAPPFRVGDVVLDRYRVENQLGTDELGYTYTVSDLKSPAGPSAALRVLRLLRVRLGPAGLRLSEPLLAHWRSQLEATQRLRHPSLPAPDEICFGDELGRIFLVRAAVELEGQPLRAVLSARPSGLSEAEATRLVASIAEALEHLHKHGILHLHLSPSRIVVVPDGGSIAVRLPDSALLPAALCAQLGEPGYLSPELIEDQPCDRRTDQFAVAVILYELLSGQPAFIGDQAEDRATILARIQHEDPLPLALSRPLERALFRALSRSRAVRFPTLTEFIRSLAQDETFLPALRPAAAAAPRATALPRRPVLFGVLAACLVLCVLWLGRRPPVAPPPAPVPALPLRPQPQQPSPPAEQPSPPPIVPTPPAVPPAPPLVPPPVAVLSPPKPLLPPPSTPPKPPVVPAPPIKPPLSSPPKPLVPPAALTAKPVPVPSTPTGPSLRFTFATETGQAPSPALSAAILGCLRLFSLKTPFRLVLDNVSGRLYVSERTTSPELRYSTDFRDCLRTNVQGTISAKELYVKGQLPSLPSP